MYLVVIGCSISKLVRSTNNLEILSVIEKYGSKLVRFGLIGRQRFLLSILFLPHPMICALQIFQIIFQFARELFEACVVGNNQNMDVSKGLRH